MSSTIIDLKTGTITELSIYDPLPTISGELAEIQYTTGTFSLVSCGDAQGYKNTTDKIIELRIPVEVLEDEPQLCASCSDRLPENYSERYILVDLYDSEKPKFMQIQADGLYLIRCYSIVISKLPDGVRVVLKGTNPHNP